MWSVAVRRPSRWNTLAQSFGQNVEALAALALLLVYLAVMPGHMQSIDGLIIYWQARSLVFEHALRFGTPILWPGPIGTSKYGIGLSLLYVPGLLVFGWLKHFSPVETGPYPMALLYRDPLYVVAAEPINPIVTALSAYLVARFIRALGFGRGPALWGLALYGLASPAIVYARGDWSQPLTGLCWIAALYSAYRLRQGEGPRYLWGCCIATGFALLARPVEGVMLLPAVLAVLAPAIRPRRWPRSAWRVIGAVVAAFALAALLTGLVDWGRFGSPFTTGYEGEGWTTPLATGLAGALFSPGRGILLEFPAALLLPLGLSALRRTGRRREGIVLTVLILAELVNVAGWDMWWGGWDWGLRLFVPALPLLAVLVGCGIAALPALARPWLPALFFAVGAVWAAPCVLSDILGGYAGIADGSAVNFSWRTYPPIGAWQFLHYLRAGSLHDQSAVDILWLRVARLTHNLSLLPALALVLLALVLVRRILIDLRQGHPGTPLLARSAVS